MSKIGFNTLDLTYIYIYILGVGMISVQQEEKLNFFYLLYINSGLYINSLSLYIYIYCI